MTSNFFPPGLILFAAVPALALLPRRAAQCVLGLLPLALLAYLWWLPDSAGFELRLAGFELHWLHLSAMGRLFASAFLIATWAGGLFAWGETRREWCSAYTYAAAALSITHCGDLISLFIFWELMAVASTLLVWTGSFRGTPAAGMRYLLVHLTGGVLLMGGIAGHLLHGGSPTLQVMELTNISSWLILAGFLINAGAPPFSYWVADAYPHSSPSAMVFLSALTTKTAVFVLAYCFAGTAILIPVGLYMAIYGVIYALRENNVRRILAYSIVNQVGFMVVAVGIGDETALNGVTLHALVHILYKTVLVIAAGTALRATGSQLGTQLGGLASRLPFVSLCTVIAAAASMGVPLTSSFISKSLILQSATEHHLAVVWIILVACSAAVVFNAGIRFAWLTLFRTPDSPPRWQENATDAIGLQRLAIGVPAVLCLAIGCAPQLFYRLLPYRGSYHPYTAIHIIEQFQILLPAIVLFWLARPLLAPRPVIQLDTDWLLRKLLLFSWQDGVLRLLYISLNLRDVMLTSSVRSFKFLFRHYGPRGILARSWPTGSIALWVALILASYVVLYSLQSRSLWQFVRSGF
jgi:multicomponent Na+:H+ antiporter subunit D